MRTAICFALIGALTSPAYAQPVTAAPDAGVPVVTSPLLPPLPDVPENGALDPDLTGALAEAKALLAKGDPAGAKRVLVLTLSSNDRFTHAQRAALGDLAAPLLRQVGEAEAKASHWAEAAEAYDAAWVAGGKRADPDYAVTLLEWAKLRRKDNVREALWLARRARLADPHSAAAVELDHKWSSNEWRYPGWAAIAGGLVGLALSVVFWQIGWGAQKAIEGGGFQARAVIDRDLKTMHVNGVAATLSVCLGAALMVFGLGAIYFGQPVGPPMSPETLPALAERK